MRERLEDEHGVRLVFPRPRPEREAQHA
jgi:hypothetical protein